MLKDPVCGKTIKEAKYAGAMITVENKKIYFCSMECKDKFKKNPGKYFMDTKS